MRALAALALALIACKHDGAVAPTTDVTPETACTTLAILGCPEAERAPGGAFCPDVVRKAMQLRRIDLACITAAPDVDAVRACGGAVRCRP